MQARLKDYYMKVLCQCYSDDGRMLVCGNNYGELILFDMEKILGHDELIHEDGIENGHSGAGAAQVSNGTPLRNVGSRCTPELLTEASDLGNCSSAVRKQVSSGAIYCLTSAGPALLAGAVGEVLAFSWNSVLQGRLEADWTLPLPAHSGLNRPEVNSLVLGGGNYRAYLGAGDNKIYVFELETRQLLGSLDEHRDYVHSLAINQAENELYSGGEDGTVKLWDLRSRKTVCSVDVKKLEKLRSKGGSSWVGAVALDRSEEWLLLSGGHLPAVLHTKSMSPTVVLGDVQDDCYVAEFSNDLLAVAGEGRKVYYYTLAGELRAAVSCSSAAVYSVAFHPSNRCTTTTGASNKIDLGHNFLFNDTVLTV